MTSRVMRASGRLLLAVAILLGLSGCVALLVRGGKRLYQAATKPVSSALAVTAGSTSPPLGCALRSNRRCVRVRPA